MKTALVVILFAISAFAQDLSVAAAGSACGPVDTQFVVKTDSVSHAPQPADPSKAFVYVIEDQRFRAFNDVTARVGLDGAWVGANRGNSYLFFLVEPGIIYARTGLPSGSRTADSCHWLRLPLRRERPTTSGCAPPGPDTRYRPSISTA